MASKNFKTFCRIIDYIDSIDAELAELLRGTCADMSLGSLKGKPGITFLMPMDKAYRKKIADLAYSDKIEDANKACDMLNALIIRDVFKSTSDWNQKRDDIPNSILPPQHVEIESANAKEVVFKSGAKAVLDEGFKDSSKNSRLAVWKLVSGEIPVTSDKPAKLKYRKTGKGQKLGGYDVTQNMANNIRFKIAVAVENIYMMDQIQKSVNQGYSGAGHEYGFAHKSIPQKRRNVYLEYTMSLVNYIMSHDEHLLYNKVLPLISFQKIDFYNLLQPHTYKADDSQYLVPTMVINDWWGSNAPFDLQAVINQVGQKLANPPSQYRSYKIYSDRIGLMREINNIRLALINETNGKPRESVEAVIRVYKKLEETNAIGGYDNVFPPGLADHYRAEPSLKLAEDELRYLTYLQFESLERDPSFDHNKFVIIVNMIGEYMNVLTSDEREHTVKLLNRYTMKYLIQPREKVEEIKIFLSSTHFLFTPLTQQDMGALSKEYSSTITRPDPDNLSGIWIIPSGHKRVATTTGEHQAIANILNSIQNMAPDAISGDTKRAILSIYAKITGS